MRKPSFRLLFLIAGNKKSPVRLGHNHWVVPCLTGRIYKNLCSSVKSQTEQVENLWKSVKSVGLKNNPREITHIPASS